MTGYLRLLGLTLYVLVFFSPFVFLVLETGRFFLEAGGTFLPGLLSERRISLMLNSVKLALAVAAGGMVLGVAVASVLWRWQTGPARHLRWLIIAFAAVPPYIHAMAWISAVGSLNAVLQGLGLPQFVLAGWFGSWWVEVMAFAPLAVALALIGLESVNPEFIHAGRLQRTDQEVFFKIALPMAAPLLIGGAGLLFLLSITEYSIPALFQRSVYALEIFSEYSAGTGPARAFIIALPLLAITSLTLFFLHSAVRSIAAKPAFKTWTWVNPPSWSKWFKAVQVFACCLVGGQIAVPLAVLIAQTGSVPSMVQSVVLARQELTFSLLIAGLAALACLPPAVLAAEAIVRNDRMTRFWWTVVLFPLAVPAPLVGVGLVSLWNRPMAIDVYGSDLMPVLAAVIRFLPVSVIIILAHFRRIDPLLLDAASIFQAGSLQTLARVRLPLLAPGLFAAACVVFALTLGELGASIIVAPPGKTTLAIRLYNLLHYGATETIAGLCLLIALVTLVIVAIGATALTGRSMLRRLILPVRGGAND